MTSAARPTVGVSIVHWNGGESTVRSIESVLAQGYDPLIVIVVDNGSTDGAMATVASRWPQIRLVRNADNTGFTGGHNQGIELARRAGADHVLLLNQDARLLPGSLDAMVRLCETDERIGLVSPVIYYEDEPTKIQFAGSWVDWKNLEIRSTTDPTEFAQRAVNGADTICLWGTALLVRRTFIEQVGVFDPALFAYFEDLDLSVRAARAGWKARMCFDAGVLHEGHRGWRTRSPHYFYFMNRNALFFWRKHAVSARRMRVWRDGLARSLGEYGNLRDAGMHVHADACLLGIRDAWVGRGGSFDPARKAPTLVRKLVQRHPFLFVRLAKGNFRQLLVDARSRGPRGR